MCYYLNVQFQGQRVKDTWIFSTVFRKILKYKISRKSVSGNWVVPCGKTEGHTERQTDMTKLIVTFRNFANAPKNAKWNKCDAEFCVLQIYVLNFGISLCCTRKFRLKNNTDYYTEIKHIIFALNFNLHGKTKCQQQRTIQTPRRPITYNRKKRREDNIKKGVGGILWGLCVLIVARGCGLPLAISNFILYYQNVSLSISYIYSTT